jgi:HEAT repeat protein
MTLVAHLNDQHPETVEGLEVLINTLPQEVTPTLCEILAELESPRVRRMFLDLLVRRARAGVDLFIRYLQDPRVELVGDMARILGRTRLDKAVKPLKGLMRHPDERVRVAALEALTELGPAKAGDVVMRALGDADPRVRGAALRGLGKVGRVAVPSLIQIIDEPEFSARPLAEKKSVFRALGTAGGEDLVPFMEGFLVRKGLFRRGFDDETRACACEALSWIGGRKATELLEKQINDKSSAVRSAALAGIRRVSGMHTEDDGPSSEERAA